MAARRSYGRNVPSGTCCSFLRRQRHCAVQEPGRKAHTAPLFPASSGMDPVRLTLHKQPLSWGGGGRRGKCMDLCSQLLPVADGELKQGQGEAHFSSWQEERPVVSQSPLSWETPQGSCREFPAQPAPPWVGTAVGEKLLHLDA